MKKKITNTYFALEIRTIIENCLNKEMDISQIAIELQRNHFKMKKLHFKKILKV